MVKKIKQDENLTDQIIESSRKEVEKEKIEYFSSGCDMLDLITGKHPLGRVINLVGDSSSGKTFLALEILASFVRTYNKKARYIYDDAEGGYTFDSKELFGFDAFRYTEKTSETVEEMSFLLKKKLKKLKEDQKLIYVVDSLDGLSCAAEIARREEAEKLYDKGKDFNIGSYQMEKQKFMSEFFRVYANEMKEKNCNLIIISQVRENIGVMFGKKYKRAGGKALDFYSNQIIWLAEAEKIKKKDRVIGVTVKVNITKNKNSKPFRTGFIRLYFDYGIDNITTNILYLYDLLTDAGKDRINTKTIIEWDEKEYKFNDLISYIEDNNLEEELTKRVKEKWNKIEEDINIRNKRKKRF